MLPAWKGSRRFSWEVSGTFQLPHDFELEDGKRVRIRRAWPSDRDELIEGFEQLSPRSRYLRFFSATPKLTDRLLRQLTSIDGDRHVALVAEDLGASGKTRGLGVARFIRHSEDPTTAELALTVIDEIQGHGLGRALLDHLVVEASRHGVSRFIAVVLPENRAMNGLMRSIAPDAEVSFVDGAERYEISLDRLDPGKIRGAPESPGGSGRLD